MDKHTPARIRYEYQLGYCGELIASSGATICRFVDEPSKEDARRIVACWNACDGVDTEWLEECGGPEWTRSFSLPHWAKDHEELAAQRNELLEALEELLNEADDGIATNPITRGKARAAIAKAKGEE